MDSEKELAEAPVCRLFFRLALPSVTAQIVNVLYNIIDRVYIGHIPGIGASALTGVGIILVISAFAALVSMGCAPRASIMMGKGEHEEAEKILGTCTFTMLILSDMITVIMLVLGEPILLAFGASSDTIGYALGYIRIYSLGTVFVQLALGLNSFITAQGFALTSMLTVVIGAVCNIILDPILIFCMDMGVEGAALATTYFSSRFFRLGNKIFMFKEIVTSFEKKASAAYARYPTALCIIGAFSFFDAAYRKSGSGKF